MDEPKLVHNVINENIHIEYVSKRIPLHCFIIIFDQSTIELVNMVFIPLLFYGKYIFIKKMLQLFKIIDVHFKAIKNFNHPPVWII